MKEDTSHSWGWHKVRKTRPRVLICDSYYFRDGSVVGGFVGNNFGSSGFRGGDFGSSDFGDGDFGSSGFRGGDSVDVGKIGDCSLSRRFQAIRDLPFSFEQLVCSLLLRTIEFARNDGAGRTGRE